MEFLLDNSSPSIDTLSSSTAITGFLFSFKASTLRIHICVTMLYTNDFKIYSQLALAFLYKMLSAAACRVWRRVNPF